VSRKATTYCCSQRSSSHLLCIRKVSSPSDRMSTTTTLLNQRSIRHGCKNEMESRRSVKNQLCSTPSKLFPWLAAEAPSCFLVTKSFEREVLSFSTIHPSTMRNSYRKCRSGLSLFTRMWLSIIKQEKNMSRHVLV
jgi:hypothetical protein